MENLHETTRLSEILKALMQEWLLRFPTDQRPMVQVKEDDRSDAAYMLGPVVTLVTSREYEVTALDGDFRFYLAPTNAAISYEKRKSLNEDRKRWIPSNHGPDIQVPYTQRCMGAGRFDLVHWSHR